METFMMVILRIITRKEKVTSLQMTAKNMKEIEKTTKCMGTGFLDGQTEENMKGPTEMT
eukprot:CAMPEP_0202950306 /NCGR_PEP_ID=MMETSP1395-20130829/21086_1 /ASSEMBLY_ACC=CAM_ASM_000871 /TAXON_ID=5961 /ORGANISM="Blepharisma japonicum, Strain Stock R1072" /LENGTH=58 /DNA_ID=CAMNT_0049654535 /DNA_START=75 /DNA_END=251 /DNA_ORIENTATION=-